MLSKVRVDIKREAVLVPKSSSETYVLHRWVVRHADAHLVGYSTSWFGAWRIACESVGWKVPT